MARLLLLARVVHSNLPLMATYEIISQITENVPADKFCSMVSFNSNLAEYYEVESLDKAEVDKTLMAVAEQLEASTAAKTALSDVKAALVVESGKLK